MRIELQRDGMTRPYRQAWRITSPAGSARVVADMNSRQDELTLTVVADDAHVIVGVTHPGVAARRAGTVADRVARAVARHPFPIADEDAALTDAAERHTADVPDDVDALRRALAIARDRAETAQRDLETIRRRNGHDTPATAYVLSRHYSDGEPDGDDTLGDAIPVVVVIGTEAEAEAEANTRNLAHLAEYGRMHAADLVHPSTAVPILWGGDR